MDLELAAQKISHKYLAGKVDMNESIAKYAVDNSLNVNQTKRLVEECNKRCYLDKLASSGEQIFDVAQFENVKKNIESLDRTEKVASLNFVEVDYNFENNHNKVDSFKYQGAIDRCHEIIGRELKKIATISDEEEINSSNQVIEKYRKVCDRLLEKKAGLISGVSSAVLKGGAAVGGKIAKHPISLGLMPLGAVSTFNSGFKKNMKPTENFIENNTIDKSANLLGEATHDAIGYLKSQAPAALLLGAIGVGLGAAKGMGGIVARMSHERQLNENFNTIMQNNSDLKQIVNARQYFDLVARHAPSLAKDPLVVPQLIRQFEMFGGVDVNTVGKLRDIEATGRKDLPRGGFGSKDLLSALDSIKMNKNKSSEGRSLNNLLGAK